MRNRILALFLAATAAPLGLTCSGRPAIVTPAQGSALDRSGSGPVEVVFPSALPAGAVVSFRLLAGADSPPAAVRDVTARMSLSAGRDRATGTLVPWELAPGRNTLFANVDQDGDGKTDVTASSTFTWDPEAAPSCDFGKGALPADSLPPGTLHGDAIPIDHFVVVMQENRSADHYLSQLHSDGQPDADPGPADPSNPDPTGGPAIHAFHQTKTCEVADLSHSWNGTHREWHGGAMDGFTAANVDGNDPTGSRTMGFHTRADLPYYYALYDTFAMGDRYFSSVLSQTFPNRFYLLAATSFGHIRNDIFPDATEWTQPSIFETLDRGGVSWKIYRESLAYGAFFAYVRDNAGTRVAGVRKFVTDAAAGTLPQVSFVDLTAAGGNNIEDDEHPTANIQVGQKAVANVVNALLASPQWTSSALVVIYDEHGGFWDHVPPPRACTPDDIPPDLEPGDAPGAFDRYGIRVPMVMVSPFSKRHYVSHRIYDHTSVLRLIETRFDLPALTRRDANADPMLDLFDFEHPPFLAPPTLPPAVLDPDAWHDCDPTGPPPPVS